MRRLLLVLIAVAAMLSVLLLGIVALAFWVELALPLDNYRGRVAAAVSQALGIEASIEGSLRAYTGPRPGIELHNLRLSGAAGAGRWIAQVGHARLRVRLSALLAHEVRIVEASAAQVSLCAAPEVSAPTNAQAPPARPTSAWRLVDIDLLKVEHLSIIADKACASERTVAEIGSLEGRFPAHEASRLAASGTLRGQAWQARLGGPALASLSDASVRSPFDLALDIAGARLRATGAITPSPLDAEADVVLDAAQLAILLAQMGAPLKDFGPALLRAHMQVGATRVAARIDEARLAPLAATGDLSIDWSGARPHLSLRARTDTLDTVAFEQWLAKLIDPERIQPGRLERFLIARLRDTEGEFAVDAARVLSGGISLDAFAIAGDWRDGIASGSLAAHMGQAAGKGTFRADVRSEQIVLAAEAGAESMTLPGGIGITGTIRSIHANIDARGPLGPAFGDSLRAAVIARDARLAAEVKGIKHPLLLGSTRIEWRGNGTLRAQLAGTALGERLDARLDGGDVSRLLRGERWPLRAAGALGPLRVTAAGDVALPPEGVRLNLNVAAAAGRLGPRLGGQSALAGMPLEAKGRIDLALEDWHIELTSMRLGNSRGRASARGALPLPRRPIAVEMQFDLLDLAEWASTGAHDDVLERELLPGRLVLPDAELVMHAARVALPRGTWTRLEGSTHTRGSRLERASFAFDFDGAHFEGQLAADLHRATAQVSAALAARGLENRHLGGNFAESDLRLKVGNATLAVRSTGNRLRELAANADLQVRVNDVAVAFEASGDRPGLAAALATATLSAAPERPTALAAEGRFAGQPLLLEASTEPLAKLLAASDASFNAAGKWAGVDLTARGRLPRGAARQEADLEVRIDGDRLDALNAFLGADLPPVGPFVLEVALHGANASEQAEVQFALGESRVHGRAARRLQGDRAEFEVNLTAPLLRLEDLGAEHWVKRFKAPQTPKPPAVRTLPAAAVERVQAAGVELRRALRRFDARVRLVAEQVTSAGEVLGGGEVAATLEQGRLQIAPFRLAGRHGNVEASLDADLSTEQPRFRVETKLEGFRYGALLKSMDRTSEGDGELSLKLHLSGSGALAEMAPTLEGQADLVIFPRSLRPAVLIDAWGGGLLHTLLGRLDASEESRINCAVASFDIARGQAKSVALMLDSTRIRAAGELEVGLTNGALKGLVAPQSKHPEVLSARLPVTIGGTLQAPDVRPVPGSLAISATRYFYFGEAYLVDFFTTKRMPADGSDDCIAAYRRLLR